MTHRRNLNARKVLCTKVVEELTRIHEMEDAVIDTVLQTLLQPTARGGQETTVSSLGGGNDRYAAAIVRSQSDAAGGGSGRGQHGGLNHRYAAAIDRDQGDAAGGEKTDSLQGGGNDRYAAAIAHNYEGSAGVTVVSGGGPGRNVPPANAKTLRSGNGSVEVDHDKIRQQWEF